MKTQGDVDNEIFEFLTQSNGIEGVYDSQSHRDAKEAWDYLMKFDTINPQLIRQVHKILMKNQPLDRRDIGRYRTCPVFVGNQKMLKHTEIHEEIRNWCRDLNNHNDRHSDAALERMAQYAHIQYEKIHPFVDGNGRTGRMFMNWHRLKILKLPLLIIHIGEEQMEYYKWFK